MTIPRLKQLLNNIDSLNEQGPDKVILADTTEINKEVL